MRGRAGRAWAARVAGCIKLVTSTFYLGVRPSSSTLDVPGGFSLSKSPSKTNGASATVADQVAEFIGRSMGELLNRKDALTKQMADVDQQIAEVRQRVVRQFGSYLPSPARAGRTTARKRRTSAAAARAVSEETRNKMAEAARKRWARERAKKTKGAKAAKTSK
jgi:hypothetical protein